MNKKEITAYNKLMKKLRDEDEITKREYLKELVKKQKKGDFN